MLHRPEFVQFKVLSAVFLFIMFQILRILRKHPEVEGPSRFFFSPSPFLQMSKEVQLAQGFMNLRPLWIWLRGHLTFQADLLPIQVLNLGFLACNPGQCLFLWDGFKDPS